MPVFRWRAVNHLDTKAIQDLISALDRRQFRENLGRIGGGGAIEKSHRGRKAMRNCCKAGCFGKNAAESIKSIFNLSIYLIK